jgi:hypothetical protein
MSSAGTSSQYNAPVVVNLDVQVDTSGNLVVFGEQAPTVQNVITATVNLPVRALYDASGASNGGLLNSLFEFWEPEESLGERRATLSGKDASGIPLSNRDYTTMSKKFVCDLQAVLDGSFDCSGASPYDDQKYASTTVYNTQSNFGRLALSTYAHYLFGHVGATSAITNDQQFMDAILSKVNGAYKYSSASDVSGNSNGSQWTNTGSSADADLARQLVGSIITKNNEAILAIVNQVLGQDASRAMDQDNNALAPGVRHALKFIAGDTIFMNIKLITPSITVGNGQLVDDTTLQNKYTEETYMLKITLSDAEGVAFDTAPTTTAPGQPVISQIKANDTTLFVYYTAPADGGAPISSYYYSTDVSGTTYTDSASTANPLVITGLTNNTTYNVRIKANNAVGLGPASEASQGTPTATNVIPDVDPSGNALSDPGLDASTQPRFFKYSFTPTSSTYNAYLTTNSSASSATSGEIIYSIYQEGSGNIINNTNITDLSGVQIPSGTTTMTLTASLSNRKAFTINNLTPNQTYFIIMRTVNNQTGADVILRLENGGSFIPIIYTQTGSAEINNNLYALRNVIPDTDPSGNALTNPGLISGIRFFKYAFTTDASSCSVYMNTNSSASTEEIIYSIYQEGSGNIISSTTTDIIDLSGVQIPSGTTTMTLTASLINRKAFTLTNLTAGTYYIITRTLRNHSNVEVGLGVFSGLTQIPLTYTQTGTAEINNNLYALTNVIPDTDPSGNALTNPGLISGIRFFKYAFITTGTPYDVYINTNAYVNSEEIIYSIYQEGSGNIISDTTTNIIDLSGVSIPLGATTMSLTANLRSVKAFRLTNLTAGTYYIIMRTNYNESGVDVGLGLFDGSTQIPLTYIQTGTTEINNNLYTIALTNVIPDVDTSGNSIGGAGTRFFKFSFIPTSSIYDVYMSTNGYASTEELIYSIYQDGSGNIIDTTNITNFNGVSVSGSTIITTNSMLNVNAFKINNLIPNTLYYIITRTTYNDTGVAFGSDIGIGLFDATTQTQANLTYVSTGTTEAI